MTAFSFHEGFGIMVSLFPVGMLKIVTHSSPGNLVYFNQSDEDLEAPECFQFCVPYALDFQLTVCGRDV